jgi:AbrB family looped-hinge helix DNA binding protein
MTATLSSKCQVVIPARMRRVLGMKPHSRVEFEQRPDGILIRPAGGEIPEHVPEFPRGTIKFTAAELKQANHFGHTWGDPE